MKRYQRVIGALMITGLLTWIQGHDWPGVPGNDVPSTWVIGVTAILAFPLALRGMKLLSDDMNRYFNSK